MSKYLIFVEGPADVVLIRDYLKHLYNDIKVQKHIEGKRINYNLTTTNLIVKIIEGGGFTAVKNKNIQVQLLKGIDDGYKIILILDSDNPHKDYGGYIKRAKYLEEVKNEFGVNFDFFLFPDNMNDGDLETLLLKIVRKNKFQPTFDCYEKYADCVSPISKNANIKKELLEDKNKIFNFFRIYYNMEMAKEENRKFESEYWDFSSSELDPLKSFLTQLIK